MSEDEATQTKENLQLLREFIKEYEADPRRFNIADLTVFFKHAKKLLEGALNKQLAYVTFFDEWTVKVENVDPGDLPLLLDELLKELKQYE